MRSNTLKSLLFGAALALSTAGPGNAAQSITGLWSVSDGTTVAVEARVNTSGTTAFATFLNPISTANPRGSWSFCQVTVSVNTFTCTETVARGGQIIGGTYRAPTSFTPGRSIIMHFGTRTMEYGGNSYTITPIELVAGGTDAEILANMPATGIYVPRIKTESSGVFMGPFLSGTGVFLASQSDRVSVTYLTYHADGSPIWFSMSGAVTAFSNVVTLSGDFKLAGTGTSLGTAWFQSRNNGGHRLDPPGVFSQPDNEHWVSPLRSDSF